ncbi:MAG: class I SAM-dependent methyltransferase [Woeseiaceae bacterium]|nr:class I SAM-dependent methyltransferase [Woeseiaceae bacterium]
MSDTGWSDYWEKDGDAGGEVFVSAQGGRHPALAEYWQAVFADLAKGASVLDVASGAGSIFAHLDAEHGFELHATDIAPEALAALSERIPGVTTAVSGADELPYEDASFDLVVSQYGIEYAGRDAFAEAARLVKPGGRLAALVHIEDGYVDSNNKAQLDEATTVREIDFIGRAIDLTNRAFSGNRALMEKTEQAFVPLITRMSEAIQRCPRGIHVYLLAGFKKLYENRQQYRKTDIVEWLEQMNGELSKTLDRLARMRAAAMSADDMAAIEASVSSAGLTGVSAVPFETEGNDRPIAWSLTAKRLN